MLRANLRRKVTRAAAVTATTGAVGVLAALLSPGGAAAEGGRFEPGEYRLSLTADARARPLPFGIECVPLTPSAPLICAPPSLAGGSDSAPATAPGSVRTPASATAGPSAATRTSLPTRAGVPADTPATPAAARTSVPAGTSVTARASAPAAASSGARPGEQDAKVSGPADTNAGAGTTAKQDRLGSSNQPSPERFGHSGPVSDIGVVDTPGIRDRTSQLDVDVAPSGSVTGIDIGMRGVGVSVGITDDNKAQLGIGLRTPGVTIGDIDEKANGLNGSISGSVDVTEKNSVSGGVDVSVSPDGSVTVTGDLNGEFDVGFGTREFGVSVTREPDGTWDLSTSNNATYPGTTTDVTVDSNGRLSTKSKSRGLGVDVQASLTANYTVDPAHLRDAVSSALGYDTAAPRGGRVRADHHVDPSPDRFGGTSLTDIGAVDTPGVRDAIRDASTDPSLDGNDPTGAISGRGTMSDENADRRDSGLDGDDSTGASSGRGSMSDENADRGGSGLGDHDSSGGSADRGGSGLDGHDSSGASSGRGSMSDENADRGDSGSSTSGSGANGRADSDTSGLDGDDSTGASSGRGSMSDENADRM